MDISRENEYLLYLAVQSVRGGRVMTLPEGQDYASLFSRAGQAGVFRAVAGGIAPQLLPDEGRRTLDGIAARELRKQHDAAAILAALENEGVDCLPLDGFAFGALYTGEAKREIKDFNILIREQQAEKADRLLTKRGLELFREGEGVGCYRGRNAPNIFLHTQSGAYGGASRSGNGAPAGRRALRLHALARAASRLRARARRGRAAVGQVRRQAAAGRVRALQRLRRRLERGLHPRARRDLRPRGGPAGHREAVRLLFCAKAPRRLLFQGAGQLLRPGPEVAAARRGRARCAARGESAPRRRPSMSAQPP